MEYYSLVDFLEGEYPIELPEGWIEVFQQMCEQLDRILRSHGAEPDDIAFLQVKEKYGQMRVYPDFAESLDVNLVALCDEVIEAACSKTADICCECGDRADYNSIGWICPFCLNCAEKMAADRHISLDKGFKKISR